MSDEPQAKEHENQNHPEENKPITSQLIHVHWPPYPKYGKQQQSMECPFCKTRMVTRIKYENGLRTHCLAAFLSVGCCWWIPYAFNSCKNADHYCPSCGVFLGSYEHISFY